MGARAASAGWAGPLVGVVADELPSAVGVLGGALDDQAVVGPDDVDAAGAAALAGEVDEDGGAVDERGLHRLAHDLQDAALAGVEAVFPEPVSSEHERAGDAFVVDDGPAAAGRRDWRDATVTSGSKAASGRCRRSTR